jgi:hypothetical protein
MERKEDKMNTINDVDLCAACRTVPVAHLSLDLREPLQGWPAYLEQEGIEVIDDDLGRPAISRLVFGAMVRQAATRRKMEAEARALRSAEQVRRPRVVAIPGVEGRSAYESLMAAEGRVVTPEMEFLGRERPNFLADAIDEGHRAMAQQRRDQKRRVAGQRTRERGQE